MKKIIIYLTIFSMLNLVGCYYQEQMSTEELSLKDDNNIQVTTIDTVYHLKSGDYQFTNDTLFATVSEPLDEHSTFNYTISIPVKTINKIEVENIDTLDTTLATVGIVAVVLLLLVYIGLSQK